MNRNIVVFAILCLLVVSALAVAGAEIKVGYVLEVERDGRCFVARETDGFYSGEKFSMRIEISRSSRYSALGKELRIRIENESVYVNDSKVIITDIITAKGVIHVIDAVLIP